MMVHLFRNRNSYLHHDGAFFISSLYFYNHNFHCTGKKYKKRLSLAQPRRAPRERPHGIFQLAESVIVGNTLPSEVPVPQAAT